ncbi:Crp/Fnr family transcriptional regulator [Caenimonas aquaedulcis]|uniref:Cyclic nucleotide-binding domain-containing protein n=1 Tax=Caenimonas aquaedulcis TaxID=2793270 RepID=A0A931H966_9BURK|nr:cyclic nucleotide-binding domain-containing protein [Caenimonas aquaedulcis]MBG9390630.1 cyclic nucleotide-binding domain-containing protein [Caenimonas aquaedulcis]
MNEFDNIDDHFARYARELSEDPSARFAALRQCSFFQPVPDDWLRRMSEMAQVKTFRSDVCVTTQDEEMRAFYVILYGSAEAYRNGKVVGRIETGDCFGEGIFFADGQITTSATVIADDKFVAAEFSKTVVEAMHADAQAMVSMNKALMLALFKKLNAANRKIERLMLV